MDITKEFIRNTFKHVNLQDKYLQVLENSIKYYQIAFVSKDFNPIENYELYEYIGDSEINNAIVWYFYKKYPQLRCVSEIKTLTRLKNLYVSTDSFSQLAIDLNFEPYIKHKEEDSHNRFKLLEDVFEAFIGVTKIILDSHFNSVGIASQVIYNFIEPLFDKKEISLDYNILFDAKTRLKELFDQQVILRQKYGKPVYEYDSHKSESILYFQNDIHIKFYGVGNTKQQREKQGSQQAIDFLKKQGYNVEKKFNFYCRETGIPNV